MITKLIPQNQRSTGVRPTSATILCDSMSALQAFQNPGNKLEQQVIHATLRVAMDTKEKGIALRLQWMPGHYEDPENNTADRLAKETAVPGKTHPFST